MVLLRLPLLLHYRDLLLLRQPDDNEEQECGDSLSLPVLSDGCLLLPGTEVWLITFCNILLGHS